jgi:FkbM family methyltransferase
MIKHIDELDSLKLKKHNGIYERKETNLFKTLFKPDDVFVDVGAHIGYYVDIAKKIIDRGDGMIYAFEPERENYELLRKNIDGSCNRIKLYNCGVGAKTEWKYLYLSNKNTGDHRAYITAGQDRIAANTKFIALDVENGPIKKIDFIKIDTQGYEIEVLRGTKKTIENSKDINMLIEYSPRLLKLNNHTPGELIGLLIDFGFYIYIKANNKRGWGYLSIEHLHNTKISNRHTNFFCSRKKIEEIDWGIK